MKTIMKGLLATGFVVVLIAGISGCSTVAGAGKDIQKAGQVIEHEAKKI